MAESDTETSSGTSTSTGDADSLMNLISTVNTEGITAVYASGFLLTLAIWAIGAKIGLAIQLVRKM